MSTITLKKLSDFSKIFNNIRNTDLSADIDVIDYSYFLPKEILMLTQYFIVQLENVKQKRIKVMYIAYI